MQARPCICKRVTTGRYYQAADCRQCWLYHYSPTWSVYWGKQPTERGPIGAIQYSPELSKNPRGLPCVSLGPIIQRSNCHCPLKFIHKCDKHGQCTRGVVSDQITSCVFCPDYQGDSPFIG